MTELLIDRQRVVLPRGLNMQVIEENPFFTKNGTYTLDVTLSLEEDENAKVYRHINRMHVVDGIGVDSETGKPMNRTAMLIVDNEVVLNGTEIVTDWSDSSVTIQLVSGNSELNFLIGGERKLRDLELGSANVDADTIKDDLDHTYPERNWLILPFIARNMDDYYEGIPFVFNRWNLRFGLNPRELYYQFNGNEPFLTDPELNFYKNYRPQPYLCFIIESVLKSLGYSLTYNTLAAHPVLRYMYVVHGFDTWEFAKMLPDWTVNEFIGKIETQFDCTLVIDEFGKTAGLYFNNEETTDSVVSLEVHDEYTTEIDRENVRSVQEANIGYDIDTSEDEYYLYQKLDKSVKEAAIRDTYTSTGDLLSKVNDASDAMRFRKILIQSLLGGNEVQAGDRFIVYNTGGEPETMPVRPKKVDSFRNLIRDSEREEIDIALGIIPAPMQAYTTTYHFQYPVVQEADPVIKKAEEVQEDYTPVQDLIEGDSSVKSVTAPDKMYVAMYSGRQKLIPIAPGIEAEDFPLPYVESLAEFFIDSGTEYYFNNREVNPFRLEWLDREIYSKWRGVDTTRTYKLTYTDQGKIDIKSKFVANNKALRCAKIERTITIDGFAETVRGDFYPYNNIK